jgi:predicted GIY-YIG superfamily endonuclease
MENCVYILLCRNLRYYIGSTKNLNERLKSHHAGYVKATAYLRPLQLVFATQYQTIKNARQIEYKLKKFKNKIIIDNIVNTGRIYLQ